MPDIFALPLSHQQTAEIIHKNAADHGFWPEEGRNFGEIIALIHSELSEALEEHRDGNPVVWLRHTSSCPLFGMEKSPQYAQKVDGITLFCDCNPKPEGAAVELIDAMIREYDTLFSILEGSRISVDDVLRLKIRYNMSREYKHGKAY